MHVTLGMVPACANRRGPLLRLVLLALAAFLCIASLCQEAQAQVNMTLGQLMPSLIRNTSQVVTATSAGLQVAEAGSVAIGRGSSVLGTVAINELRSIPLGALAGRVVTSAAPVMLAMLAVDLLKYGITQCVTSPNGWCKPGQVNSHSGDVGFNGQAWQCDWGGAGGGTGYGDSPDAACAAGMPTTWFQYGGVILQNGAYRGTAKITKNDIEFYPYGVASPTGGCATNYIPSPSACIADPNANVKPVPITYPELSPKLADALSGNPQRAKDYWGFMPWTDQLAALGDPSTQALPAQVVSPADGKVTGPSTTTTTPNGTTTQQTSCTVSPNSDAATLASKPVSVACTITTTNPDGTTSTSTTTTTPTTTTDPNAPLASSPAANPAPASSPTPCGLGTPGSPKCQIDETGTKQQSDVDTAQQTQISAMTQAESALESAANTQLSNVDAQHQTNSAHFFTVLNMIPSFGTETCTPPTINDTFNHVNITPAICDWYYAAKDLLSLVIAFGLMLSAVFMVKDTAQSTAAS